MYYVYIYTHIYIHVHAWLRYYIHAYIQNTSRISQGYMGVTIVYYISISVIVSKLLDISLCMHTYIHKMLTHITQVKYLAYNIMYEYKYT